MASGRYVERELLPLLAMVTAECVNVGSNILYKAAVTKGLSYHVFMVYSYAISALILIPLSYLFHRKTQLPPFTLVLLGKISVVGFLGFIPQYLGYRGILYSSPTLGSAMSNITPATTFILAILCRMEKLKLRSFSSQAKIIGTIVTIAGAIVVVLCKGPILIDSVMALQVIEEDQYGTIEEIEVEMKRSKIVPLRELKSNCKLEITADVPNGVVRSQGVEGSDGFHVEKIAPWE